MAPCIMYTHTFAKKKVATITDVLLGPASVLKRMQGKERSEKAANTNHSTHAGMLCNGNGLNMFMIK